MSSSLQPVALMVDAGTVSLTGTGVKAITGLSTVLTPGWYATCWSTNGTPTMRLCFGLVRGAPILAAMGANSIINYWYKASSAYGAYSNPPPAPDTAAGASGAANGTWSQTIVMQWTP